MNDSFDELIKHKINQQLQKALPYQVIVKDLHAKVEALTEECKELRKRIDTLETQQQNNTFLFPSNAQFVIASPANVLDTTAGTATEVEGCMQLSTNNDNDNFDGQNVDSTTTMTTEARKGKE